MICANCIFRILAGFLLFAFISPAISLANERLLPVKNSVKQLTTPKPIHLHHQNKHVLRVDSLTESSQINDTTGIWCFACVSGSLSNLSRAIFMRSIQIPPEAESVLCDDPFNLPSTTTNVHNASGTGTVPESVRWMGNAETNERQRLDLFVQPCKSSCIKAVLQSRDANIVLRGCLTSIYQQISERDYFLSMPAVGSCDEQRHHSKYAGTSVTQTCICSSNYCNAAGGVLKLFQLYILLPNYLILLYLRIS